MNTRMAEFIVVAIIGIMLSFAGLIVEDTEHGMVDFLLDSEWHLIWFDFCFKELKIISLIKKTGNKFTKMLIYLHDPEITWKWNLYHLILISIFLPPGFLILLTQEDWIYQKIANVLFACELFAACITISYMWYKKLTCLGSKIYLVRYWTLLSSMTAFLPNYLL